MKNPLRRSAATSTTLAPMHDRRGAWQRRRRLLRLPRSSRRDARTPLALRGIFGPVVTRTSRRFKVLWKHWASWMRRRVCMTGAIFANDRRAVREAQLGLRNAGGQLRRERKPPVRRRTAPFGGARSSARTDKAARSSPRSLDQRSLDQGNVFRRAGLQVPSCGRIADDAHPQSSRRRTPPHMEACIDVHGPKRCRPCPRRRRHYPFPHDRSHLRINDAFAVMPRHLGTRDPSAPKSLPLSRHHGTAFDSHQGPSCCSIRKRHPFSLLDATSITRPAPPGVASRRAR